MRKRWEKIFFYYFVFYFYITGSLAPEPVQRYTSEAVTVTAATPEESEEESGPVREDFRLCRRRRGTRSPLRHLLLPLLPTLFTIVII